VYYTSTESKLPNKKKRTFPFFVSTYLIFTMLASLSSSFPTISMLHCIVGRPRRIIIWSILTHFSITYSNGIKIATQRNFLIIVSLIYVCLMCIAWCALLEKDCISLTLKKKFQTKRVFCSAKKLCRNLLQIFEKSTLQRA